MRAVKLLCCFERTFYVPWKTDCGGGRHCNAPGEGLGACVRNVLSVIWVCVPTAWIGCSVISAEAWYVWNWNASLKGHAMHVINRGRWKHQDDRKWWHKRELKEYIKSFSRNDRKQNYIALWHNLSSTTDHFSAGRLIWYWKRGTIRGPEQQQTTKWSA